MKKAMTACLALVIGVALCGNAEATTKPKKLTVTSTDFTSNGAIPATFGCSDYGGSDVSPQISWTAGPKGTKFYALVMSDPDAVFYHWGVANLTKSTRSLAQGAAQSSTPPLTQTYNDFGTLGYGGPCPPPGEQHHYVFTVYALPKKVSVGASDGPQDLQRKAKKIALATGKIVGLFPGN